MKRSWIIVTITVALFVAMASPAATQPAAPNGVAEGAPDGDGRSTDQLEAAASTPAWTGRLLGRPDTSGPSTWLIRFADPAVPSYEGGRAVSSGRPHAPGRPSTRQRARAGVPRAPGGRPDRLRPADGADARPRRRGAVHLPVRRQRHRRRPDPGGGPRVADDPAVGHDRARPGARAPHRRRPPVGATPTRCGTPSRSSACPRMSTARASSSAPSTPASTPATPRSPTSATTATTTRTRSGRELPRCVQPGQPARPGFDPTFPCNDKLIGAYGFLRRPRRSARDYDGHGSHTASTSGGNVVNDVRGRHRVRLRHARVRHLRRRPARQRHRLPRLLHPGGSDRLDRPGHRRRGRRHQLLDRLLVPLRGLERLRHHRVPERARRRDLRGDLQRQRRPQPRHHRLTGRRAVAHVRRRLDPQPPRRQRADRPDSSGGPLADIDGKSVTGSLPASTPIVDAGAVGDPFCLDDTGHEADFAGKIVVCARGGSGGRVEKSQNVRRRAPSGSCSRTTTCTRARCSATSTPSPASSSRSPTAQALRAWLASGTGHAAAIAGTTFDIDAARGDIMASFSSRGPNGAVDTIVPAVTAPGVDILAAYGVDDPDPPVHGFISGTSMASPHVAGAGALLTQARPDWSPAQQQSALMTTARTHRPQPRRLSRPRRTRRVRAISTSAAAARAGLLFDETSKTTWPPTRPTAATPRPSTCRPSPTRSAWWSAAGRARPPCPTTTARTRCPADVTWTASATGDAG